MKPLNLLKEDIDKCVRCGTCKAVCPTYNAVEREQSSARGRLTLVGSYIKGEIGLTEVYLKHIKECTLCNACYESCPNGVDTARIITAARIDAVEKKGLPLAASLLFKNLLAPDRMMPWALKLASKLKGLFLKENDEGQGLTSRFEFPLIGGGRLLPPFVEVPFMELAEVKALSEKGFKGAGPKIAFYAGCGINYLMPGVGLKTIELLKRAGAEVIVPPAQVCCGMPAYYMGDIKTAKEMALKNLEALESCGADYIVTSCATCGNGLKNEFKEVLGDMPEVKERLEAFSFRVKDVTELLTGELKAFEIKGAASSDGKSATYHDPCHLARNQSITKEPRELIKKSGLEFREMKGALSCCGLGGGLSTTNYGLSSEVTRKKVESIRETGADIVVTACPGCMVQLRDGLHRFGVKAKVRHIVELL